MKQIRVKELPEGYFVSATYYPSGNVEFVSMNGINPAVKGHIMHCDGCYENVTEFWENENGKRVCKNCIGIDVTKSFGTKHIQLIAVNVRLSRTSHINGVMVPMLAINLFQQNGNEFQCSLSPKKISQEQFDIANNAKEQGKDFFIYKVSEEK